MEVANVTYNAEILKRRTTINVVERFRKWAIKRIEMCKHFAVWAACELIQVAAMCEKFQKLEGKK